MRFPLALLVVTLFLGAFVHAEQACEDEAFTAGQYWQCLQKQGVDLPQDQPSGEEMFKEWIPFAEKKMMENKKIKFEVNKVLTPYILMENRYATAKSCTLQESESLDRKMIEMFNGIITSRGFQKVKFKARGKTKKNKNRNLRGNDEDEEQDDGRDLFYNRGSGSTWWQRAYGSFRRRLVETGDGADDNGGAVKVRTPKELLAVITELKGALDDRCMHLFSTFASSPPFSDSCNEALLGAACTTQFDLSEQAKLLLA